MIWWIRRDLRLGDNPALVAAAAAGAVLPTFVLDDRLWGPAGAPRQAWLIGALDALEEQIGRPLTVGHGDPAEVLGKLAQVTEASKVVVTADFGPYGRERDERVRRRLGELGVAWEAVGTPYAVAPGTVSNGTGAPYRVFTPFSRAWQAHGWERPWPAPARMEWVDVAADDLARAGVSVGRRTRWVFGARDSSDGVSPLGVEVGRAAAPLVDRLPVPGELAALQRWRDFAADGLRRYAERRNSPALDGTSQLSVYLRWGCIHPRTLLADLPAGERGADVFRSEVCWREFYADVLWHHPTSARQSLQPVMARMQVDSGTIADQRFEAWCQGRTGYPIVDAGMRQLLATGWMHNRVRMITASFLVKDLHVDWTRGARHFMAHLVDGDLASNSHGWQWVAGTGTDAAPYFRVFNPVTQGRKFDPDGSYIRRWVPELAALGDQDIHAPWEMPQRPLGLGDYPDPIVDHAAERDEALARYAAVRA